MGLISQVRSSLENPQTPLSFPAEWLLDTYNGGRTDSGTRVSEMLALQVSTVFACCEIKGGAVGALSLKIFEKLSTKDGRLKRRIAHDHQYWDLLEHEPNPEMSAFTMKKTVQVHRMLWGNGYIELQRDRSGRIIHMWPRNPARIRPMRAITPIGVNTSDGISVDVRPGQMVYVTTEGMETESLDPNSPAPNAPGSRSDRYILPADILHIPGLSLDGRMGQGVIYLARNAVGLALATERFGGKFFANGAVGRGVFKLPGAGSIGLPPEDMANIKKEIQEAWGGENVNRPMVMEGGMEFVSTSVKPDEAQFLETREHQVIEICRDMGVPPHMVGVTEKTSRANTEQIGQEFLTFSLANDLEAWQQEIKRKMLPAPTAGRNAGKRFGVFFDTWPLVTPSANDLRLFIQAMVQWGVWEPDDAREKLNMNPLDTPASKTTWMQINMAPTAQLYETPALPSPDDGEDDDSVEDDKLPIAKENKAAADRAGRAHPLLLQRLSRAYSRLFRDAFDRICARSKVDEATFRKIYKPVLVSIGEQLDHYAAAIYGTAASSEGFEESRFLTGYVATMFHRFEGEKWQSTNADIYDCELKRAIRALAIEAYRNAATAVAKIETEVES